VAVDHVLGVMRAWWKIRESGGASQLSLWLQHLRILIAVFQAVIDPIALRFGVKSGRAIAVPAPDSGSSGPDCHVHIIYFLCLFVNMPVSKQTCVHVPNGVLGMYNSAREPHKIGHHVLPSPSVLPNTASIVELVTIKSENVH
jgi:hypothetical protein